MLATKTIWQCPLCERDGCVNHHADTDIHSVIAAIVAQHAKRSPLCYIPFDKLRVKMWDD